MSACAGGCSIVRALYVAVVHNSGAPPREEIARIDERERELLRSLSSRRVLILPVAVLGRSVRYDTSTAAAIAKQLDATNLGHASVAATLIALPFERQPNEAVILWSRFTALAGYVAANPRKDATTSCRWTYSARQNGEHRGSARPGGHSDGGDGLPSPVEFAAAAIQRGPTANARRRGADGGDRSVARRRWGGAVRRPSFGGGGMVGERVEGPRSEGYIARTRRNSVGECQLPKLDVAGSSPVARSMAFSEGKSIARALRGPGVFVRVHRTRFSLESLQGSCSRRSTVWNARRIAPHATNASLGARVVVSVADGHHGFAENQSGGRAISTAGRREAFRRPA